MLTKEIAIKTIKDFVLACEEKNITFSKVFLFGSVAINKTHEYSDIDVAFVSDKFSGMPFKDWSMLTPVKTSNRRFTDIEPHPYTPEDFEEGDPLIDEIKRTGIEIK